VLIGRQVLRFDDEGVKSVPPQTVVFNSRHLQVPAVASVANVAVAAPLPPAPTPIPLAPPAPVVGAPTVGVFFAGVDRQVAGKKGQTVLELASQEKINIKYSCKVGRCGECWVHVTGGAEHLNAIGDTETGTLEDICRKDPGPYRLACMARVSGPVLVDIPK
jgi:ferredoxin